MVAVAKLTEDERRLPLGLLMEEEGGREHPQPCPSCLLPALPPAVSMAMGSRWRRTACASHLPLSEQ